MSLACRCVDATLHLSHSSFHYTRSDIQSQFMLSSISSLSSSLSSSSDSSQSTQPYACLFASEREIIARNNHLQQWKNHDNHCDLESEFHLTRIRCRNGSLLKGILSSHIQGKWIMDYVIIEIENEIIFKKRFILSMNEIMSLELPDSMNDLSACLDATVAQQQTAKKLYQRMNKN